MTEQNRDEPWGDPGHDDTTRIPAGSPDEQPTAGQGQPHQHAYPSGGPSGGPSGAPYGGYGAGSGAGYGAGYGPYGQQPGAQDFNAQRPRERRSRPSGGLIAALLIGALVVGGLSGIAGAAGFSFVDHKVNGSDGSTGVTSSTVVKGNSAKALDGSVEQVAHSVLPSVVKINVSNAQEAGSGSGIILSSDGVILTNNHVVQVAGQNGRMTVNFNNGTSARASVVGTDPMTDLAVIRAQGVSGLTPATIDTGDNVDVGQQVVAIGSPFGLEATVTSGIVSALNRPVSVGTQAGSTDTTYPAIQTDAAINPGNSGGPLVNAAGEVVGINSSIRTASDATSGGQGGSIGLGFAIPISKVWPVVQELRNGQTPTHARLGVSVSDASSNNGLLTGAGIEQVNPGSAAAKAGLQKGDVITKVNSDVVTSSESLVAMVRGYRPGDRVTLTFVRGGKTQTVTITLDSDEGSATS